MDPSSKTYLQALIEASLTGRLAPHEHDQLEKALEECAEIREEYLRAVEMHLDLHTLSREVPELLHSGAIAPAARSHWTWLMAFGLACTTAACLFLLVRGSQHEPAVGPSIVEDHSVAPATSPLVSPSTRPADGPVVLDGANAQLYGHWHSPAPGDRIKMKETYALTSGMLALEFSTGAQAILQAPCLFSVLDVAKLEIRSGKCSVHAPPGAEGFEVVSPSAEIVDLGTRFVVDVADTGETQLFVVEGKATLASSQISDDQPLELTPGLVARVEPGQRPTFSRHGEPQLSYHSALPDRVIRYYATEVEDQYADELTSVLVQRGGKLYEYGRDELIRSRLTHFVGIQNAATFCTRRGEELPTGDQRLALLDEDWSLVTGIINPRSLSDDSSLDDPILSVEFSEPIENGPGPDILLFDLQLLVYPASGDRLRVRSGDAERTNRPVHLIDQFDIDMTSPFAFDLLPHRTYRAGAATTCLDDLLWNEFRHGHQVHVNAKAIVVGIDLSDLGYEPGESLRQLDLLETGDSHNIDPVLIVGLPRVPDAVKTASRK